MIFQILYETSREALKNIESNLENDAANSPFYSVLKHIEEVGERNGYGEESEEIDLRIPRRNSELGLRMRGVMDGRLSKLSKALQTNSSEATEAERQYQIAEGVATNTLSATEMQNYERLHNKISGGNYDA